MTSPLVKDPLAIYPSISDWLTPETDRLIVRTGRVELGQGIHDAIARIAATELGLPVSQVHVPHASTATSPIEGITAGSMSVSAGGMAVRSAAAALRTLILRRAAKVTRGDPGRMSIQDGMILLGDGDTGLAILDLAGAVDLAVEVRSVDQFDVPRSATGRAARPDIADRVAGRPFLQDLAFDDMLHGRVIHPPAVPAVLDDIDMDALAARPGVLKVVRDANFLGLITTREWDAVQAGEWGRERAVWTHDAGPPGTVLEALRHSNAPVETSFEDGAPTSGGETIVTTISRPLTAHGSIGPSAAIALWEGNSLTVWSHSQGIGPLRTALAAALRIDPEDVTVQHVPSAGCYGHNGADDAAYEAALLARAVPGRHMRLQWSRADEFGFSASGAAMQVEAEARVTPEGHITDMIVRPTSAPHMNRPGWGGQPNLRSASLIADPHPVPPAGDLPLVTGGGSDRNAIPLYALSYRKVEKRLVGTLPYRTSSQRALGAIGNVLAIEALFDDVAARHGADPIALRLAHLDDLRARAVIEAVADMAGPPDMTGGDGHGWGIGFAQYKNNAGYCAVLAEVVIDEEVSVHHIWAAVDAGEVISEDGVRNQIEGGILQAMSWTLKESLPVAEGRVIAETWEDYPILKFSEVPPVDVQVMQRPDDAPLGVGEAAAGPTAAALSNAVRHALGQRIPDLPLNRDTIARALLDT